MGFSDKLKKLRKEKGLTQQELADAVGLGKRAIAGYESGNRFPKKHEVYDRIADALGCTYDYLVTDSENFIIKAGETYGNRGRRQAEEAVNTISGMFAGGELDEEDRDAVLQAIQEAYWDAKKDNKSKR